MVQKVFVKNDILDEKLTGRPFRSVLSWRMRPVLFYILAKEETVT
jgi:hypothetical protein